MDNILIIDDDPTVQALFTSYLEKVGYTVIRAANGKEGLRQIAEETPSLVITDIMMPEMDGLELLHEIRTHHPNLPVIAISGGMQNGAINFLPTAKKLGACCVLKKPVPLSKLLETVKKMMK